MPRGIAVIIEQNARRWILATSVRDYQPDNVSRHKDAPATMMQTPIWDIDFDRSRGKLEDSGPTGVQDANGSHGGPPVS